MSPGIDDPRAGTAAVVLDEQGGILAWSDGAEVLLGHPAVTAVGRPLADLLLPEDLVRSFGSGLSPFTSRRGESHGPLGRWAIPVVRGDGRFFVVDVTFERSDRPGEAFVATFEPHVVGGPQRIPGQLLLARIFEHAPEAVTVVTRDGRQQFVNRRGLELLGYGGPDGQPVDARLLVHPEDLPGLAALMGSSNDEDGQPTLLRYRARSIDGAWRWLESVATDLTGDPDVGAWIVFTRDVTLEAERAVALRTAEARLEAVVASVNAGALLEDADRRGVLWNGTFVDLVEPLVDHGTPAGFDAAATLLAIAERYGADERVAGAFRRLGAHDGTETVGLADGRVLDIESVGIRRRQEDLGRLWLLRNVTEREQAAQQRERLLALEQEARQLAEEQAAQLQAFDQLRTDFVATVSHELRTPLTSVISAVDYLLTATPEEQAEDLSTLLQLIQRNASRLSRLVDDLLVLSRLDAGMIVLDEQDVDLVGLVMSTVEDLRSHSASRAVALSLRTMPGPLVRGDPGRLQQVVENLLTNAIKFTEAGTTVEIGCTYAAGAWTVSVRDHGPGIEPQERERIFDRFYRTRSGVSAGTQGTGLGLTISRGFVALHGGTLTAHSPLGGGAELVCVLPDRTPGG